MVRRVPGHGRKPAEKPTVGDLTHQLSNSGTEQQLLSFVERYERLTEEVEGLTEDRKEEQFLENESLRDTYLNAVKRAEAARKANPGAGDLPQEDDE
jgi:hypothetical protein